MVGDVVSIARGVEFDGRMGMWLTLMLTVVFIFSSAVIVLKVAVTSTKGRAILKSSMPPIKNGLKTAMKR